MWQPFCKCFRGWATLWEIGYRKPSDKFLKRPLAALENSTYLSEGFQYSLIICQRVFTSPFAAFRFISFPETFSKGLPQYRKKANLFASQYL